MEFFSREIRAPDEDLLSMLTSVGNQIGLFVDRRRAQEELDRFFTLSLDMLCIAGFDGYFKRVNPAWERTLGYTEADLLSRPFMEFVHPDDREATIAESRKQIDRGQEVIYFENRYLHKDGTLRWLMWTSTPFRRTAGRVRCRARHHRTESRRRDDGELCARARGEPARARRSGRTPRAARQRAGGLEAARPKKRRRRRARSSPT